MLSLNGDQQLIVNGELVHFRDIHRDLQSDSPHSHDDEDDATMDNSSSDVGEISDSENEADKYDILRKPIFLPLHLDHMHSKTPMNEEDPHLGNPSKGKEKEHETTPPPPEPQGHNQTHGMPGTDLLRFLVGSHFDTLHRRTPYERPGVRSRGPTTDYEDFEDVDSVPPKRQRRRDMFPSHFMPSFRAPRRKPLPEFVIGPSRITLDDL